MLVTMSRETSEVKLPARVRPAFVIPARWVVVNTRLELNREVRVAAKLSPTGEAVVLTKDEPL